MKLENLISPFRPADGPPPEKLIPFFNWCLSGAWPVLALATVLSALAGGMEALSAWILGHVIDTAVTRGPQDFFSSDNLLFLTAAVGFFIILRPVVFWSSSAVNAVAVTPNLGTLILTRLHRWTLGQSVVFFDDDFAGRIAQKQMQTSRALTEVVIETINVVAFALASLVGSAALIVSVDSQLAVWFVLWLAVYLLFIRYFLPRVKLRAAARASARAMVSGQVVDTITNIKTVKLFAHADHEDRAALNAMRGFRDTAVAFGRLSATFRLGLMVLAGALPVILVGGALLSWRAGNASAGDIVAIGSVAIRIAQMTGWVSFALMGLYANLGEVEDGMRTLTPSVRVPENPQAEPLKIAGGQIEFTEVDFAYGRKSGGVTGVNLTIHPGEKLGIVGASGAGKSTLVALLLRLYDPEKGHVAIDGQDLRDVSQESLHRQIGMVTQETAMFNRSARDNILYGRPDASVEDLIQAARSAEAHEFILGLVDHKGRRGYDAHLGERGVKLSGGQRQRIALARAILKDAPILVLDEATSALDSEVEAAIQSALERVMTGKTVLAVAHRLSTISRMDRIVVLHDGQIVEVGSHEELLKLRGRYFRYWDRQSGGFIDTRAAAE